MEDEFNLEDSVDDGKKAIDTGKNSIDQFNNAKNLLTNLTNSGDLPKGNFDSSKLDDSLKKANQAVDKAKDAASEVAKAPINAAQDAATGGASAILHGVDKAKTALLDLITEGEYSSFKKKKKKIIIIIAIVIIIISMFALIESSHVPSAVKILQGDSKEIDEALDTIYPDIIKLTEDTYDKALEDAEEYCIKNGYDWNESKATLSDTSSSSAEEVYKDSNYLDLLSMLNVIKNDKIDDSTTYKDYQSFFKEKKLIKGMYYISYEPKEKYIELEEKSDDKKTEDKEAKDKTTKKQGKVIKYVEIKIYPYALETILKSEDYTPEDKAFDEIQEYNIVDYVVKARETMIAFSDDKYIKMYRMENDTPIYQLVATEDIYSDLEDIANIDLGDFDTSEWYTDVPVECNGSGVEVLKLFGWMPLYNEPTYTSNSDSYYVNCALARSDIARDIAEKADNVSVSFPPSSWCSYEFSSYQSKYFNGSLHGVVWDKDATSGAAVKNGRLLVAVGPGIVYKDYYSSTAGIGNNSAWYDYSNKKMDVVLKDKMTDRIYYLPVTTGDAKGHAFPYGIGQTGIATPKSASQPLHGSDFKSDTAIGGFGTAEDYGSAINNYSNKLYQVTGKYTIYQWETHGVIEFCLPGIGYNNACNRIGNANARLSLMGVIVY